MGLRLAIARLIATPLFTVFSVLSLAAGVALTTAVYSVVDTLILADLGVSEPDRAAFVLTPGAGLAQIGSISDPDFEDLRSAQTSFSSLSAAAVILPSVAATGNAEILTAEAVDGAYFATLGIGAQVGRMIHPADHAASARVVVVSDEFWRGRLAADPNIVGREIRINGQPFEVIGVAPARYRGVFGALRSTRLWMPLAAEAQLGTTRPIVSTPRERRRLLVFGRLATASTIAGASAELATISARLDRDYPSSRRDQGRNLQRSQLVGEVDRGIQRRRQQPAPVRHDAGGARRPGLARGVHQPRQPRARPRHGAAGRARRAHGDGRVTRQARFGSSASKACCWRPPVRWRRM